MIYVTHDQTEALTFADTVVVMHDGAVVQIGTPDELFERPGAHLRRLLHRLAGHELLPAEVEGGAPWSRVIALALARSLRQPAGRRADRGRHPARVRAARQRRRRPAGPRRAHRRSRPPPLRACPRGRHAPRRAACRAAWRSRATSAGLVLRSARRSTSMPTAPRRGRRRDGEDPQPERAWLLVLPVFAIVAFSAVIPLMTVVNYSVQDTFGNNQFFWNGVGWFQELLDPSTELGGRFFASLWRNLAFSGACLAIEIPLGIVVALSMPREGWALALRWSCWPCRC